MPQDADFEGRRREPSTPEPLISAMGPGTLQNAALLLVEPDVVLRLGLSEYLRSCGYRVLEAANAQEAHALLEGAEVAVMLVDAQLAGPGGGFELSRWAHANKPEVEVVLAAGLAGKTEAAARLCESKGRAPCSLDELKARIGAMRAWQARPRRLEEKRKPRSGAAETKAR